MCIALYCVQFARLLRLHGLVEDADGAEVLAEVPLNVSSVDPIRLSLSAPGYSPPHAVTLCIHTI